MGNFDDFDLDLKKVSVSSGNTSASISPITITLANKCQSVEVPTTGMTTACCAKSSADVDPRCI